jgi:hypothetical protein
MNSKKSLPLASSRLPSVTQLKQGEMHSVTSISWNGRKGIARSRHAHFSCNMLHNPHNWGVERENKVVKQVMTAEKFPKPITIQDI